MVLNAITRLSKLVVKMMSFDVIKLTNIREEKKLSVIIDNELKLKPHIKSMCNKAAQKIGGLNRICSLLNPPKKTYI